jgi:hypothetical protein
MNPEYMSEEFLNTCQNLFEIAKKAGVGVRFADDFSLPFNNFYQSIALQNSSLRAKQLILESVELIPEKTDYSKTISNSGQYLIFTGKINNDKLLPATVKQITNIQNNTVHFKSAEGNWQIMFFKIAFITEPEGNFIPNVFSSEAAQAYCTEILDKLWVKFSKFAPNTFEGIVTEIPAYLPADNAIPWDDDLPVKFKSRYRKDLFKLLPTLFFEVDDISSSARVEFYNFIGQMMYERFAGTIESWVKKHRVSQWVLTPERSLLGQANSLNDCLAFASGSLAFSGVQAQDGTGEGYQIVKATADFNALQFRRGTVAVAGRSRSGTGASLQTIKTEVDLNAMNGPARILIDGCFFNLDHRNNVRTPFNPFWYSPCWNYMNSLTSYSSRISELVNGVQFSRPAAIVMPTSSLLVDYIPGNSENLKRGLSAIQKTIDELQRQNIAYDIISEDFFVSCLVRTNGEFGTANRIRKGNYQVAIIPYARLIKRTVLSQIEKLVAQKGKVIFTGEAPIGTIEDGASSFMATRIAKLLSSHKELTQVIPAKEMGPFLKHIDPAAKVSVAGKRCPEIYTASGSGQGYDIHILHNTADKRDFFANVSVPAAQHIYIADCQNGELTEIKNVTRVENLSCVELSFSPRATYVLITSSVASAPSKSQGISKTALTPRNYRVVLKDQWLFVPDSLNVLPLANWNNRIGLSRESGGYSHYSEAYLEAKEIPEICILSICGSLVPHSCDNTTGKTMEVSVNGTIVDPVKDETNSEGVAPLASIISFCGRKTPKYDIKNLLTKGFNRISIRTVNLTGDPRVLAYPPFIAGTFSISKGARGWTIDKTVCTAGNDSWTKYGFPYMSGSGVYKQDFELPSDYKRIMLRFSMTSGPITIFMNQKELGTFAWHPMEIDITEACEQRRNTLEVRVLNTMDNLLRMNGRPSGLTGEVYLDVY